MTPATCRERGCGRPAAVTGGRTWDTCDLCAIGQRPAMRRKVVAAEVVAAMAPLVVLGAPGAAFGFRVPGSPRAWNNALIRPRFGRPYSAPWVKPYKEAIRAYAERAIPRFWRVDATYAVTLHSVFDSSLADADGPVKLVLDALQGLAFSNDRQVTSVTASKAVDPRAARLEVVVRYAEVQP